MHGRPGTGHHARVVVMGCEACAGSSTRVYSRESNIGRRKWRAEEARWIGLYSDVQLSCVSVGLWNWSCSHVPRSEIRSVGCREGTPGGKRCSVNNQNDEGKELDVVELNEGSYIADQHTC